MARSAQLIFSDYYTAVETAMAEGRLLAANAWLKEALLEATRLRRLDYRLIARAEKLADIFCAQGDFTSAATLYRFVTSLREDTLGQNHPAVWRSLEKLRGVLNEAGGVKPAS